MVMTIPIEYVPHYIAGVFIFCFLIDRVDDVKKWFKVRFGKKEIE